jgi:4-hydroxythreonine-4-phosphate dehydrogenase
MLLVGGGLRVVPATIHCALREVPERIARLDWLGLLRVLRGDLERSFGIASPRIALCGLNPHASDGGRFGDEEERILSPVVRAARAEAIDVHGPLSADSVFTRALAGEFDCVVGTYHDQVLGPLKTHAFGRAVNVTLGLPIVRTSVDHGTAFDIAGRGRADPGSLEEAIRLALAIAARRRRSA